MVERGEDFVPRPFLPSFRIPSFRTPKGGPVGPCAGPFGIAPWITDDDESHPFAFLCAEEGVAMIREETLSLFGRCERA